MRHALARAHQVVAFLILAASFVQFFLAGLGVFGAPNYFGMHAMLGMLIGLASLVLLLLSLASWPERTPIIFSALLFVLMIAQTFLAHASVPFIAALHPVNGLLILFMAHELARGRWQARQPRSWIETPAATFERVTDRPADTTA